MAFSHSDDKNLGGAYIFDTSEDTVDYSTGQFTYELTNAIISGLAGTSMCAPSLTGSCNVCHKCCKSYITNERDCNACVAIHCKN